MNKIVNLEAELKIKKHNTPRCFMQAACDKDGKELTIECHSKVTIDVEINFRHGTALSLRNLQWQDINQKVDEPLMGRPILQALGFDCEKTLAAAADRFSGTFDASNSCAGT